MCYKYLDKCGEKKQWDPPCETGKLDGIQGMYIRDEDVPSSYYGKYDDYTFSVIDVIPQQDYTLKLKFSDGSEGVYDMWPWIVLHGCNPLKDIQFFMKTYLDGGWIRWSGIDFKMIPRILYEGCMNFEEYRHFCVTGKANHVQSLNDVNEVCIDEYETLDEEMSLNEILTFIGEQDGSVIEITVDSNDHIPAHVHINDSSDHTLIARVLIPSTDPKDVNDIKPYNGDKLTDELKTMIFKTMIAHITTCYKPVHLWWKVKDEWDMLHIDDRYIEDD